MPTPDFHSITIGDKHTWNDWHLVPASRPIISPPSVNEKYVDIPGRNGAIDLTTVLTGAPTYANRKGSWEFYVITKSTDLVLPTGYLTTTEVNNLWTDWMAAYQTIMAYLHGKSRQVILDDDPNYFYTGRLSVNAFKSSKDGSTITIDYNLSPYKTNISNSSDMKL